MDPPRLSLHAERKWTRNKSSSFLGYPVHAHPYSNIHLYLAALPDEVKQIITDALTLIAART